MSFFLGWFPLPPAVPLLDPNVEFRRLKLVRDSGVFGSPAEEDFDDLTRLAAQWCEVPIALVTVIGEDRQWIKSSRGIDLCETPRDVSFCTHALAGSEPLIVRDALEDPRFASNPLVVGPPGIRFYAGFPLILEEGLAIGTLCVIDHRPRELNATQLASLDVLRKQVVHEVWRRMQARRTERSASALARAQRVSGVGSWELDLETGVLSWSDEIYRVFGMAKGDFRANYEAFLARVHPEDRARMQEAQSLALAGTAPLDLEHRIVRGDGSIRWVHEVGELERAPDGKPVRLTGVVRDVTESRRAIEELRRREALLAIAGATARIGGWTIRLPSLEVTWSDEIRRILEAPQDHSPALVSDLKLYESRDRERLGAMIDQCALDGTPFDAEFGIRTFLGRPLTVRVIGQAVRDPDGGIHLLQGAFQDITALKEAEKSVATVENRLRQLGESLPFMVWTADAQGRIDHANQKVLDYAGLDRDDDPNSRWHASVHPDDLPGVLVRWESCKRAQSEFDIEYRLRRASDDEYRWFRVQAVPIRDPDGSLAFWYGTAIDIHDTRSLQAEATRLAARLTATLESIADGFVTLDNDWRFTYANTEAGRMLKRDRAALLGRTMWEAFPEALGTTVESFYREAMASRRPSTVEFHFEPLATWFEIRAYPFAEGMAIAFRDVTRRREDELKLREQAELLDKARDAILVRGLDHRILYWNRGAETLYGWSRAEIQGKSVEQLLYKDPSEFKAANEEVLRRGEWNGRIRQVTRKGEEIVVEGRWTLVRDQDGSPRSILAINTDLSERLKLEQQFLRAQRMESIGTLAGGIAHDLNNLLAPIIMGVDLLRSLETSPSAGPILDTIDRSAHRGADLVKQVLSFARGVEGARVPVQVTHLLRDLRAIVTNTFPKNIRLEMRADESPWTVVGDPTQLNQVLLNLCVNARDAMPEGGLLLVRASNVVIDSHYALRDRGVAPGRYLVIEVVDDGAGMKPEVLERVFEPFFTTKEVGKGSGLGLSTVLGIVRSHGGFINVYSEVGRGSTFKVYLPAQPENVRADKDEAVASPPPHGKGELVLVVDDEVPILAVTRQTLEAFGYRVIVAEDGAAAIAQFAQRRGEIALVLTDMMMPVMDGPALIAALRRIDPELRIIAASGLNANAEVAKASRLGVRHFLPKPYSADHLLRLVRDVLGAPAN